MATEKECYAKISGHVWTIAEWFGEVETKLNEADAGKYSFVVLNVKAEYGSIRTVVGTRYIEWVRGRKP